ncbi:MAG: 6-pyruvoyl-tetrahydropterin synthase-related protein [bacterium]|nr:6-pyruvoyl-tetrahydropterin synthase-related protein [bacterium]
MKKLLGKYWPYILITVLGLLVSWPLIKSGYFSHQDDLQVIRIFEMRKCISDLQIPCRWVPDMGWGNGLPLFNFYGVFPYYLGAILSFFIGFIGAAKLLFFIALCAGSFGMYFLIKSIWGKLAGIISAVLYLYAPYKALDVYVRGALSESMALALIPFVFYFAYKLITSSKKKYGILFSIFLFLFLITHNIMTIIFLPVLFGWLVYWLIVNKWKNIGSVATAVLFGIGLSAFFILPAFFEKNLVQTESLTRFELDYKANYLKVRELFIDRVWGYGTSIPGPEGGMSFQIGWPHWILVVISAFFLLVSKVKRKTKVLVAFIIGTFVLSIFMTHNKSTPIWVSISLLKYFQFPWRFLSLSIFTSSILGGFIVSGVKKKWQSHVCVAIIFLSVFLNWGYFRPKEFYSINDTQKLSGESWDLQRRGALLDYLPSTALEPREKAQDTPFAVSGEAIVTNYINHSNKWEFITEVKSTTEIEVPVYYFPNWKVKVDKKDYPSSHDNLLGRITVSLKPGNYEVEGYFQDTPLRSVANTITAISLIGLIVFVKWKKQETS